MKAFIGFLFVAFFCVQIVEVAALDGGRQISRIKLDGNCIAYSQEVKAPAESLVAAVAATVATAAVTEIFVMGKKWFSEFKDSYKGSDVATNVDYFYCRDAARKIGIKEYLTYERRSGEKPDILLKSIIKMNKGVGSEPGFFTITPLSLAYNKPVAKRGKAKDITIVYSFTFFDTTGKESNISASPILIKNVTAGGGELTSLDDKYGIKAILPLPHQLPVNVLDSTGALGTSYSPVILKIEFIEVSTGKGEELLGNIAANISSSMEKKQDVLIPLIVSKLLKDINVDVGNAAEAKQEAQVAPKPGEKTKP
jgi:hypothetical protein